MIAQKFFAGAVLILVLICLPIPSATQWGESPEVFSESPQRSAYPQIMDTYIVTVHLNYFICDPDLDPWIAGDPDPYFIVHVEEQAFRTGVYEGVDEIYLNLNCTFTLTPKNPVILVRIEAWDDDTGFTLRDDEIDIDPNTGTVLDIWYNLITKSWFGDTNTTLACGDSSADWGKLAFYIDAEKIQNPVLGNVEISYLNGEYVYIDGILKSMFKNRIKDYSFENTMNQQLSFNFHASDGLYVSVVIYNQMQTFASNNFTGFWETSFYALSGTYHVYIGCSNTSGYIEIGFNTSVHNVHPAENITTGTTRSIELMGRGANFLMCRMIGMDGTIFLTNTKTSGGAAFLAVRNIEPDMFVYENAEIVSTGRNTVLLKIELLPSETMVVRILPWYVPSDYWYVFMSDSQPPFKIPPGGTVEQSTHFLNIINLTNVVNPPLILHAGDYVDGLGTMDEDYMYGTGYTSPVNDYEFGELLEALGYVQNFLATAVGNHDVSRAHTQGMGESLYKEWVSPLYYSFDYGNSHFIMLDTYEDQDSWWFVGSTGMYGGYIYGNQKNWLNSDLNANTKPNTVVVMHHSLALPPDADPEWTVNETFLNRSNALEIYNMLYGKVSLVHSGHIHDYVVYNLTATSSDVVSTANPGLPCIMAGNAGGTLDKWYFPYYGFVMVHVNNSQILGRAFIREDLLNINISYSAPNDGTRSENQATIVNNGCTLPYLRLKFVLSNAYPEYMAYSLTRNTLLPISYNRYAGYTVAYVTVESLSGSAENILVCPVKNVSIDGSRNVVVLPDTTVLIPHNLTNSGYTDEFVAVNVTTNISNWHAAVVDGNGTQITDIFIPAQSTATIYIRLIVPPNATNGDNCAIQLTASIKNFTAIYSTVTDVAFCAQVFEEFHEIYLLIPVAIAVSVFRKFYRHGRYKV